MSLILQKSARRKVCDIDREFLVVATWNFICKLSSYLRMYVSDYRVLADGHVPCAQRRVRTNSRTHAHAYTRAYICTRLLGRERQVRWGKYAPTLRLRQVAVFKSPETYARLEERRVPSLLSFPPPSFLRFPIAWHCIFVAFRKLLGRHHGR